MNLGQRNKISVGGNMSSMTDLVFLLLIFFMVLLDLGHYCFIILLTIIDL